ncbi:MAG: LPS export ABC transporter periplasmic protein LptC, partial [Caulobacter sp.]|nr:LPS export ABC transporter periplasmic protein LptC [Caulobacter sp.]
RYASSCLAPVACMRHSGEDRRHVALRGQQHVADLAHRTFAGAPAGAPVHDLGDPRMGIGRRHGQAGHAQAVQVGQVAADGNLVRLKGNVAGDSAEGHPLPTTFRTSTLELLPDQHLARTDDQVTLTQPGIMQTGVGFRANLQARQYQFLSQVKTRYEPSARH